MNKLKEQILRIQVALEGEKNPEELSQPEGILQPDEILQPEEIPQPEAEDATGSEPAALEPKPLSKKEQAMQALMLRGKEINAEDLPRVEEEMMAAFEAFGNGDYFTDLASNDYFRLLDVRGQKDARIVVVGDLHSDFISLAAILLKLSVSDYDYFEKGIFVFLGDYLDRGIAYFEPLLLLFDLKRILGERMIMLRGNHELIAYNEETQQLEGRVSPLDTVPVLNEYCINNKDFLKAFARYYSTLPTYVWLKAGDRNVLLTHGAVPRDIYLSNFSYDRETGAIVFEKAYQYDMKQTVEASVTDDSLTTHTQLCNARLLRVRNEILNDMIWGDPSQAERKYQVSGRYEVGSLQFEDYAQKNGLSLVMRSHEPVDIGVAALFDNRFVTVFSTGGAHNSQSGYTGLQPAFAVIGSDGSFVAENSNLYRVAVGEVAEVTADVFDERLLKLNAAGRYRLNDEFCCSVETVLRIMTIIAAIKSNFTLS